MFIKICGITSVRDALAVGAAGADAIGLMFYEKSPRCVTVEQGAEIAAAVQPSLSRVGVFVNASADFIMAAAERCQLDMLQFHGEESPDFCTQFGLPSLKAFRVRSQESLAQCPLYRTDYWLLDAYTPGQHGGTGASFDWDIAVSARSYGRPFLLAGGLTPENVAVAVGRVQPFGVDVSSGVEVAPGRKDAQKIQAFVQAARQAAGDDSGREHKRPTP